MSPCGRRLSKAAASRPPGRTRARRANRGRAGARRSGAGRTRARRFDVHGVVAQSAGGERFDGRRADGVRWFGARWFGVCGGGLLLRGHLHALELLDGFPFERLLHVRLPDLSRGDAAGEAVQLAGVLQIVPEGLAAVGVPHPDAGQQLRGVADEPRVEEVLARPGLAGDGPFAEGGVLGDTLCDVAYHDLGSLVGYLRVYDLLALWMGRRLVEDFLFVLTLVADHLRDHGRLHQASAVRYGRVGGRHVERRDLVGAQDDRRVGMIGEIGGDAEPVGDVRDRLRAVLEPLAIGVHHQVGKYCVVRPPQGFSEADGAALDPVVVLDPPALGLVCPHVDLVDLLLRDELGIGIDALLQRCYESVRFEGAAWLAPALGNQVELGIRVPVADHRRYVAGLRIYRDERGVGRLGAGQVPVRRVEDLARRHLRLEVEGRVYAQAALQDGVDPVLADQLLLHHLREVAGLARPRETRFYHRRHRPPLRHRLLERAYLVRSAYVACLGHLVQHEVALVLGRFPVLPKGRWRPEEPYQGRGLGDGQVLNGLVEVGL